jgi:hypothetical protein
VPYLSGRWVQVHSAHAPQPEHRSYGHTCVCGKKAYLSRKLAKQALRRHPNPDGMRVYPCLQAERAFHHGHLSAAVVAGDVGREVYRR